VLEELLAAEQLVIGVLHPALAQHLVGKVVGVLEDDQPRHQSRRQRRLAGAVGVDRSELPLQEAPVDRPRQLHQRVAHVDDRVQPRAQKIGLSRLSPFLWSHRSLRCDHGITARDSMESTNEIASFCPVKAQKLANSKPISPEKSTLDQRLGWFFTDD